MLIASTRDNAKKMLGLNYFAMEMYGAIPSELSYAEYSSILNSKKIEAPLTKSEVVLKQESIMEVHSGVSREYVHSVQFPMDKAALSAVEEVMAGRLNVVQMQVDPEKETIDFVKVFVLFYFILFCFVLFCFVLFCLFVFIYSFLFICFYLFVYLFVYLFICVRFFVCLIAFFSFFLSFLDYF